MGLREHLLTWGRTERVWLLTTHPQVGTQPPECWKGRFSGFNVRPLRKAGKQQPGGLRAVTLDGDLATFAEKGDLVTPFLPENPPFFPSGAAWSWLCVGSLSSIYKISSEKGVFEADCASKEKTSAKRSLVFQRVIQQRFHCVGGKFSFSRSLSLAVGVSSGGIFRTAFPRASCVITGECPRTVMKY